MMFKQLIRDGQNMLKSASFLQRVYTFPMDLLQLQKIISFIGARRVGKSTIMKQVIHQLIEQKSIILEQVIWIDGNEIDPMNFDIQKALESFFSLYPDLIPFVVIDEVHELPDRVRQIFVIYNKGYKIFVSGSNAHLLSSEISTKLRGKVYDQIITGLSWTEYCNFLNFQFDYSTDSYGKRQELFESYLQWGSFPEIVLTNNKELKLGLLKNYYEVLLYKDLIERYSIDKEFVIKYLMRYLATTLSKEFSVKNFINQLKSQGLGISNPSVYNYLEYLQNIFFISSLRQQYKQRGSIKYYLQDIGYSYLRDKESLGKKFENLIIQYYQKQGELLFFEKNSAGEIDLICQKKAIQICRHLNADTLQREIAPLLAYTSGEKEIIYMYKDESLLLPEGISYLSVYDVI